MQISRRGAGGEGGERRTVRTNVYSLIFNYTAMNVGKVEDDEHLSNEKEPAP